MSYFLNNQQKLNDLVFANRNKNYGAYAIRSAYGNTMFKSIACMVSGFGLFISIAYYVTKKPSEATNLTGQIPEVIYTVPVDLKKKIKPQETIQRPSKKEPTNKSNSSNSNAVIHDSLSVETHTSTNEQTQNLVVTNTSSIGSGDIGDGNDGKITGNDGDETIKTEIKATFEVDTMPEFEGGLAALYRFVSSRLKYPGRALDEGVQGTVFVKFVVDEKGRVGSLSLLNNLGYGLDDEAKRVVALIPDFKKPAKAHGKPVKVYYQLPINFRYR